MLVMARPKTKKDQHKEKPLFVRLPSSIRAAVKALSKKSRRPVSTEVTIALEEYLSKHGLWPHPATEDDAE